jgi:DNA-binding SARP family transcriptional activator
VLVRKGYKSSAVEEVPVSSSSKLKIRAEILKGTIEIVPTDLKVLCNLAEVYMEMYSYGDAISHYENWL